MYSSDTDCCILYSYSSCSPRTGTLLARKMSTDSEWSAGSPVPLKQQQACFSRELPTAVSVDPERKAGTLAPSTRASQTATATEVRVVSKPCRLLFSLQLTADQFHPVLCTSTAPPNPSTGRALWPQWVWTLVIRSASPLQQVSETCVNNVFRQVSSLWEVIWNSHPNEFFWIFYLCFTALLTGRCACCNHQAGTTATDEKAWRKLAVLCSKPCLRQWHGF